MEWFISWMIVVCILAVLAFVQDWLEQRRGG